VADEIEELIEMVEGDGRSKTAGESPFQPPKPDELREFTAEFVATMLFVFIGAGTVVVTGSLIGDGMTPARLIAIALAHGMTITVLASAIGHISGGHINPAVTFAFCLTGRMETGRALVYVTGQMVGAVVGALLIVAVIPDATAGNLGAHTLGKGVSAGSGLLAEIVLTFILVSVIFSVALDPRGPQHLAPVAIGSAVFIDHLLGIAITGASMNPARSFGPALIGGEWSDHWIYWVGPLIGAGLAGWSYQTGILGRNHSKN
jgi:aquaporin TIP